MSNKPQVDFKFFTPKATFSLKSLQSYEVAPDELMSFFEEFEHEFLSALAVNWDENFDKSTPKGLRDFIVHYEKFGFVDYFVLNLPTQFEFDSEGNVISHSWCTEYKLSSLFYADSIGTTTNQAVKWRAKTISSFGTLEWIRRHANQRAA